jgi:hypothetical protein
MLRLFCLALVILAVTPEPALSGNRCSEAGAARMERVDRNGCARAGKRVPRGDADAMSFIFFVGILFAVLVVPVALVQQRDAAEPE